MFNIDKYLKSVERTLTSYTNDTDTILDTIYTQTGCKLEAGDIVVKNNCLYIQTKPFIKNKIFLYKETILQSLSGNIREKITDIR